MDFIPNFNRGSAVSISNARKEILFVNENYLEMVGWTRSYLIGRNWGELMLPEEQKIVEKPFVALLETEQSYTVAANLIRSDLKTAFFRARCSILRGASNGEQLVLTEMYPADEEEPQLSAEQFACAELVREVTYELAAQTGRHKLRQLTDALIEASRSAEEALKILSSIPGLIGEIDR